MSGEPTMAAYPGADLVAFATALFRRAGLDPEDRHGRHNPDRGRPARAHHPRLALAAHYLAALEDGSMAREGLPAMVSDNGGACAGTDAVCPAPHW